MSVDITPESIPTATKVFVVDTSVLLHDPQSLFAFAEHLVVLPLHVLDELAKFKAKEGELASNARHVLSALDELRQRAARGQLLRELTLAIATLMHERRSHRCCACE